MDTYTGATLFDGTINYWSAGAERIFGFPAKAIVGQNVVRLAPGERAAAWLAMLRDVMRGEKVEFREQVKTAYGDLVTIEGFDIPAVDDKGDVVGILTEARQIEVPDFSTPQGLRDGFSKYLVGECNRAPGTAFTYEQGLKRIEKWLGMRREALKVDDVRRFLRESAYHPATKNATLIAVKAFHRWGSLEGMWTANGLLQLQGPKVPRDPRPSLTPDEVSKVLDACKRPRDVKLAYLGLYAGTRITETAAIGEEQWKGDRLRFEGKGRKTREVPLHPELQENRNLILGTEVSRDTLKHVCRSLSHYTGIPFTSHTLRRTFCVTLTEAGVQDGVIESLVGHAQTSILRTHYSPVTWREMEEAIGKLHYPRLIRVSGDAIQGTLF